MNEDIMLQVEKEQRGSQCELPESCKCIQQEIYHVGNSNSLMPVASKGFQRIFSFYDPLITVHVITNSVSYSRTCRRNRPKSNPEKSLPHKSLPHKSLPAEFTSNEKTAITWIDASKMKPVHHHEEIKSAYVDFVEYFTSNGFVYVFICSSFDLELNRPDNQCTLFRINHQKVIIITFPK